MSGLDTTWVVRSGCRLASSEPLRDLRRLVKCLLINVHALSKLSKDTRFGKAEHLTLLAALKLQSDVSGVLDSYEKKLRKGEQKGANKSALYLLSFFRLIRIDAMTPVRPFLMGTENLTNLTRLHWAGHIQGGSATYGVTGDEKNARPIAVAKVIRDDREPEGLFCNENDPRATLTAGVVLDLLVLLPATMRRKKKKYPELANLVT